MVAALSQRERGSVVVLSISDVVGKAAVNRVGVAARARLSLDVLAERLVLARQQRELL